MNKHLKKKHISAEMLCLTTFLTALLWGLFFSSTFAWGVTTLKSLLNSPIGEFNYAVQNPESYVKPLWLQVFLLSFVGVPIISLSWILSKELNNGGFDSLVMSAISLFFSVCALFLQKGGRIQTIPVYLLFMYNNCSLIDWPLILYQSSGAFLWFSLFFHLLYYYFYAVR